MAVKRDNKDFGGFSLVASPPKPAILECLLLAPERMFPRPARATETI